MSERHSIILCKLNHKQSSATNSHSGWICVSSSDLLFFIQSSRSIFVVVGLPHLCFFMIFSVFLLLIPSCFKCSDLTSSVDYLWSYIYLYRDGEFPGHVDNKRYLEETSKLLRKFYSKFHRALSYQYT